MRESESDRARRAANIYKRSDALQLVVTGLVEQIADSEGARGFSGEIERETSSAAGKYPRDRVEFPAAARQIGAGHEEICRAHRADCGEQDPVVAIPEAMRSLRQIRPLNERRWTYRFNPRRFNPDRFNSCRLNQGCPHRSSKSRFLREDRSRSNKYESQRQDHRRGTDAERFG